MRYSQFLLLGLAVVGAVWLLAMRIVANRRHPLLRCPNCHSDRLRPSWPLAVDRLLRLVSLIPYRCESCRARHYALPVKEAHTQECHLARRV